MNQKATARKKTRKKQYNLFSFIQKNKKKFVLVISAVLIFTMILGVFAQFAYA